MAQINYLITPQSGKDKLELIKNALDTSLQKWYRCFTFADIDRVYHIDSVNGVVSTVNEFWMTEPFIDGASSKKKDGYVYMTIHYIKDISGEYVEDVIAQHRVIAMITHRAEYESLIKQGYKNPIVNHINGCRWDNRSENLEFLDTRTNTFHGKVMTGLEKFWPGKYTSVIAKGGHEYITLKQGIEGSWLRDYEDGLPRRFKLKSEELTKSQLEDIVKFLYFKGLWH